MMNPRDLLDVADQLASESNEAAWRSAVSRAYYSAFHVVRESLLSWGFRVPQGTQAHAYLWMRVSNCGDQILQSGGRNLNLMRARRNHADYDLHQSVSQMDAIKQVQIAMDIIK